MPEGVPGLLRIRVVNPRGNVTLWTENFENPSSAVNTVLWHSLGTEAGTDNSINYWSADVGSPTYSAHAVTLPASGKMHAGHKDWWDMEFVLRVTYNSGGHAGVIVHFSDVNNFIYLDLTTNTFNLRKVVGGTDSLVASTTPTLTNGNVYWVDVVCTGTTYSANLFNDSSGSKGSQVAGASPSGTISDAILQSGYVGAFAQTTSMVFGGAFANVCDVYQNRSYPFAWAPVVSAGEPAFCQSKVSPNDGTYSASIEIVGSSAGDGEWDQTTTLAATLAGLQTQLSAAIKATAGSARVTAAALSTGNVTADGNWHTLTGAGQMTANPTVGCRFSGAVGRAYFDTLALVSQGLEITNDLPHLHQTTLRVDAMQPGNPGSAAIGQFEVKLHPPGSDGYASAKVIYDQLDRYQRLEFYVSHDAANQGKLKDTGIVQDIHKAYGKTSEFVLRGARDIVLANLSRPFPAERMSNQISSSQIKSFLGVNEVGAADNFNPFTASNYNSTFVPGGGNSAGMWIGTTDDGLPVVSCQTGSGAALISKAGAAANDGWHTHFVEVTGRLVPSANAANAGVVGIGLSRANGDCNNSVVGRVVARLVQGRYVLDCTMVVYSGGVQSGAAFTSASALVNVDDSQAVIALTIGLLITLGGQSGSQASASLIVNGRVVISQFSTGFDPGFGPTATCYPFLHYSIPGSGTAPVYLTNLVQLTRFTTDGASPASAFTNGNISAAPRSLTFGNDPGPHFLETWTRLATREGWYWRYSPQPYVVGSRTLGSVDFNSDPGTDLTKSCIFSRLDGSLIDLQITANQDPLASDTAVTGQSTPDGGGIGFWRDVGTLLKYGAVQDEALAFMHADFNSLRAAARYLVNNKITVGSQGAKVARVQRTPETADVYRELDKVTIHDPEMGINYATARIIGKVFYEGQPYEDLLLDQFAQFDYGGLR